MESIKLSFTIRSRTNCSAVQFSGAASAISDTVLPHDQIVSCTLAGVDSSSVSLHNLRAASPLTIARSVPGAEATAASEAGNLRDAIAILQAIVGLDVNSTDQTDLTVS